MNTDALKSANNVDQHVPGVKLDKDKPDLELLLNGFPRALEEVGKLTTFGARKYTRMGFLKVDNAVNRYTSAMMRHQLEKAKGNIFDPETSLSHSTAVAWNALAILELELRQLEE